MKWILTRFTFVLTIIVAVVLLFPGPSVSAQRVPASLQAGAFAKTPALTSTCGVKTAAQFAELGVNFTAWLDTCDNEEWCEAHDVSLPGATDNIGVLVVLNGYDSTATVRKQSSAELDPMQEGEDFVTPALVGYHSYHCSAFFPGLPATSVQRVPVDLQAGVLAKTPALTSTCGIVKANQWFWNPDRLGSVLITKWLDTCDDGAYCEASDISLPGAIVHHGMDLRLGGYDSAGAYRKLSFAGLAPVQEGEIFVTPTLVGYSSYLCTPDIFDGFSTIG